MENQKTIEIKKKVTTVTEELVTVTLPAYRKDTSCTESYFKVIAPDNIIDVTLYDKGCNFFKSAYRNIEQVLNMEEITEAEFHAAVFKARSKEALIIAEIFEKDSPVEMEHTSMLIPQD